MTKTEFAKSVIIKQCGSIESFNEAYIYESSTVAVAAEFLNLLTTETAKVHASYRGGIHSVDIGPEGQPIIVSVRDYMATLPD